MAPSRHLDLGCGMRPRNPYNATEIYGIDVRDEILHLDSKVVTVVRANLALEPIPFPDGYFSSVSAWDFLEHVPRQMYLNEARGIVYPFVSLMNEIWRVLQPGGIFLAYTPAYPSPEAFQDPTHVNIITDQTCGYFCGDNPGARVYGFIGKFRCRMNKFTAEANINQTPRPSAARRNLRDLHRRLFRGRVSHLAWEFEALK